MVYLVRFLDLHLTISDDFVSSKIYDKCDDFDFDIVNFPFLDRDIHRATSYGVYISQLIRFALVSSHVADFNTRNQILTAKLLKQGYRYHNLRKTSSKFYRRHYDLVSKFNTGLKSFLKQDLLEPEFYGDLVYKFKKIVGRNDFSDQFRQPVIRYKRIGYNMNVMRQTACLVVFRYRYRVYTWTNIPLSAIIGVYHYRDFYFYTNRPHDFYFSSG